MAAVVCTQCGAEAPRSTGDGANPSPTRCRFCGHVYGAAVVHSPPPARPVIGSAPPRRTQPQAPIELPTAPSSPPASGAQAAPVAATRAPKADLLTLPFDAQQAAPASVLRPRRWPLVLGFGAILALTAAVLRPVQMGLSPDWMSSVLGKHVDPMAQQESIAGLAALNRGSSRGLIEAKQSFERALKIEPHYALALAGLADTELAMAQALGDAAQDMAHFSQGLTRKEMRRAQHDAEALRAEAKSWVIAAVPAAQAAVQLAPNTPSANRAMAELLRQQQDFKGALAWAQGGRKSVCEDAGMMVVQADLAAGHDLAGACALLERSLQKAPSNNRARLRLAQYLLKKKDAAHALAAVNAILAKVPEHELAQQMLMRLQPAASQADKVQRPVMLSFATEMSGAAVPAIGALADGDGGGALPDAQVALAADGDAGEGEAATQGPPLTFFVQAKVSAQNIWQSLKALGQSASDMPEAVAPSDLGGGMPIPSGPNLAAADMQALQHGSGAPSPQPKIAEPAPAPMPSPLPLPHPVDAPVDPIVAKAAQAPVATLEPPAAKAAAAAPSVVLSAEVQRLTTAELLQKADALQGAHKPAEALPMYQLAQGRAPHETRGFVGAGFCQLELGAPGQAADAFNAALRLSSWQAEPHFGLAQTLQAQGQSRAAIDHYRRYLSIEPGGLRAPVARHMLEELSN